MLETVQINTVRRDVELIIIVVWRVLSKPQRRQCPDPRPL